MNRKDLKEWRRGAKCGYSRGKIPLLEGLKWIESQPNGWKTPFGQGWATGQDWAQEKQDEWYHRRSVYAELNIARHGRHPDARRRRLAMREVEAVNAYLQGE